MVHIDIGSAERFGGFTAMHSPPEGARALLASCWAALPGTYSARDSRDIGGAARAISAQSDALVVLGAGGSYLGARALIEFVRSPEYNMLAASSPRVFFAGNNISAEHAQRLISLLSGRDFSVNIISKTGTTIETSLAFRVFFSLLCAKYGADGAMQRIYVTTGAGTRLDEFARENGCVRFHIPDGVGGRFSVLTAVGLLPAAVAGCDIDAVMAGAREEMESGLSAASLYASARQGLYAAGKKIEILCCFEPCMQYLCEWWKQLFGESEGKDG
ncbi:MAG: glucose-6-phosphate isomerase, partial [Oscillospiraceae bacterium]|nr:glucose-6-phosphate isomerase [Oscillospiraceae bacterium]